MAMTPSKDISAVNSAPDVHTKDAKGSAAALVAKPKENTSKLDPEVVVEAVGVANANFDNVRREEHVTKAVEGTGDVGVQNVKKSTRGGDKDFVFQIPDGKAKIFAVSRNGEPVKLVVTGSADDNNFPQTELTQMALKFCAQLGAVFVGNALNKSSSSCSCAASPSPSPSHSDFSEWILVTVTVTNLIGFVFTLIAMSLENQKSPRTTKRTVSSVAVKFGLAAVVSAIIVSMGAALPLDINGNLAVAAVASLPSLIAVALA